VNRLDGNPEKKLNNNYIYHIVKFISESDNLSKSKIIPRLSQYCYKISSLFGFSPFMETNWFSNGSIDLEVKIKGEGPLILCVHGWPELWYSWRHQMDYFADKGYRVAALNVRGYGGSSHPTNVESYTIKNLASDVAAVAVGLSKTPVILFGHDWGAPIAYQSAILYPEIFYAVAGLSVPYIAQGEISMIDSMRELYSDRFFYQLYFQEKGVAEKELEKDVRESLRTIYHTLSGDAPLNEWLKEKPADSGLLERLESPTSYSPWMTRDDLMVYVEAFKNGGFVGPINRYRAQTLDPEELPQLAGRRLEQATCLIAGAKDPVRKMIPGMDLYENPESFCDDFRERTIIENAGHWVQQEAPEETNQALHRFITSL
jgi:pimeloyl-ACP methyl ester carboxylesterase